MKAPTIQQVDVARITRGNNDRQCFAPNKLKELADNIKQHGLAQMPTLRPLPNGQFQIVAGERRIRAMRDFLGYKTIQAQVMQLTDEQASAMMLLENTSREDLTPMEESDAYQTRIDQFGWDLTQTAKAAGVTKGRVEKFLLLQKLSDYIQGLVRTGLLPVRFASKMAVLDTNRQFMAIVVWKKNPNMRWREWQAVVDKYYESQVQETQTDFLSLFQEQCKFVEESAKQKITGRRARTGVSCYASTLPPPPSSKATRQDMIEGYIGHYRATGQREAEQAVSNLYNELCARGLVRLNGRRTFDDKNAGEVGQELLQARERTRENKQ